MIKPDIEKVFSMYMDMLYRIALILLKNWQDAEDAVQDTYVAYLSKASHFQNEEHEKAWLIKVCMNICKNRLRHVKKHTFVSIENTYSLPYREHTDSDIIKYVMELPYQYKECFLLYYMEGYSCKEIGVMKHLSESAVKKRLERGRRQLKEQLKKENEVENGD